MTDLTETFRFTKPPNACFIKCLKLSGKRVQIKVFESAFEVTPFSDLNFKGIKSLVAPFVIRAVYKKNDSSLYFRT